MLGFCLQEKTGSGFCWTDCRGFLSSPTLDVGIPASIKPQNIFFPSVIVCIPPLGLSPLSFQSGVWLEMKTKHCVLANCSVKHVVNSYYLQWSSLSGSIIFLGTHFTASPDSLVPE